MPRCPAAFVFALVFACGGNGNTESGDAGSQGADAALEDAAATDASTVDAGPSDAAGADAAERVNLLTGFCPSTPTPAGFYEGTLAANLNDIAGVSGACTLSTPGRDGMIRIELAAGETLRADFRHGGDGILYLLDNCPVTSTCLAGSDGSLSGQESISYTNNGVSTNIVTLVLDSDELEGNQTFELDLYID